jgi:O-methyltransferase involved in polyketide biosynthesis
MRDYSTISPSAKSLLMMKGLTDIPFISQAVNLVFPPATLNTLKTNLSDTFLKRLIHFEARYKSLDNLLEKLGGNNILEISSGFSFRGLHMAVNQPDVTYIDTDLPEVMELKVDLTEKLIAQQNLNLKGELLTIPMNALDEDLFIKTIALLPQGPVNILNEGLLVYLNTEEKTRLCHIIHRVLTERGGHWLTADVYIKKQNLSISNDQFSAFLQSHNVEDNKFESFEQAEQFFYDRGFKIHEKPDSAWHSLSSLQYIKQEDISRLVEQAAKIGRVRETWALVPR